MRLGNVDKGMRSMNIDVFRCRLINNDLGYELVAVDIEGLPVAENRGDSLPLAYIVSNDDLARFKDFPDVFKDRGRKHKRKELSAYLVGCDAIPFIQGGHSAAGQLIRSVRALLEKAEGQDDHNRYVIGADPDVFEALKQRVQTTPSKRQRSGRLAGASPGEAGQDDRSPLLGLLCEVDVPEELCDTFVGNCEGSRLIRQLILRAGSIKAPVLLLGETDSGKEVIASAIHRHGSRKDKPFVPVNCGAIPRDLFEGELFGIVKGSFTGAVDKDGLWRDAHGGTLFLDEIGDLALDHQTKILRALCDGKFRPVGGKQEVESNARVIAATNRNLFAMVESGQFREDLYYRLRGFTIHTLPLREHPEDIPLLAQHLWRKLAGDGSVLPDEVVAEVQTYAWPGNVRDLRSTLAAMLGYFGRDNLGPRHVRAVMRLYGQTEERATGPLADWELDLHEVQCLRHLTRACDTIRAAKVALRPLVVENKRDAETFETVQAALSNHMRELDQLCLRPLLFHGERTFDAVYRLKGKLAYFAGLWPNHRREAMQFWKTDLSGQFEQAKSALFGEVRALGGKKRVRRTPK